MLSIFQTMQIIPSVDLLDGKVVRLHKGNFNELTVYSDNAFGQLRSYIEAGFKRIHVVDLNGARDANPLHMPIIKELASTCDIDFQFGGGIRTLPQLEGIFESGIKFAVGTSMAVKTPAIWEEAVNTFGSERFICGLDLLNGQIAFAGWKESAGISTEDFISKQLDLGIRTFLCTDISKDGTLSGPNFELYRELSKKYPMIQWIASGGFSGPSDLQPLADAGCAFVVIGKAFYEGLITLDQMQAFNVRNAYSL